MSPMRALLLAVAVAASGPARADPPPGAEVFEAGAYAVESKGKSHDPAYALSGGHTMNLIKDLHLVRRGNRFAAQICLTFGFRFALTQASNTLVPIDVRVTHPSMPEPDGTEGTLITWKTRVAGNQEFVGMTLDQETDLVPGIWVFEVSTEGHLLVRQAFEILPPVPGAPALEGCGVPVS